MSQQSDYFGKMDDLSLEEVEFLRSVYELTEPLGESRERQGLVDRVDVSAGGDASESATLRRRVPSRLPNRWWKCSARTHVSVAIETVGYCGRTCQRASCASCRIST